MTEKTLDELFIFSLSIFLLSSMEIRQQTRHALFSSLFHVQFTFGNSAENSSNMKKSSSTERLFITTYLRATATAVKLNDPDACHTPLRYLMDLGTIYIKRKRTPKS